MTNAPKDATDRFYYPLQCTRSMAVGVVIHQVGEAEVSAITIAMVEHEVRVVLDHLPAFGAESVLDAQYLGDAGGGQGEGLLTVAALEVRLPFGIEWVRRSPDFDVPLLFDQLRDLDQAGACIRIGETPFTGLSLEKIAFGDPPAGLVRVAASAPPIETAPYVAVELTEGLGTDDVPMVVGPAA